MKLTNEYQVWQAMRDLWANALTPDSDGEYYLRTSDGKLIAYGLCGTLSELRMFMNVALYNQVYDRLKAHLPKRTRSDGFKWGFGANSRNSRIKFCERMMGLYH